jgi:hypothetical protein
MLYSKARNQINVAIKTRETNVGNMCFTQDNTVPSQCNYLFFHFPCSQYVSSSTGHHQVFYLDKTVILY